MRVLSRRVIRPFIAASLALGTLACEDAGTLRPQWIVSVGTDAPVPGFGDRVRVDLLDEAGTLCTGCSRVFAVDSGGPWPLSFGVEPREGGGRRFVRARLFRAENTTAAGEPEDPLIDLLAELPTLSDGLLEVNLPLTMDCFGEPADPGSLTTCDPATGEVVTRLMLAAGSAAELPLPGTWGGGDSACVGAAPEGMVCVPGGVFLMGSRSFVPYGPDFDPFPEQLVRVPPFFMDVAELDVATARGLVAKGATAPPTSAADSRCTYSETPGESDADSVSCVDRATAESLCFQRGRRLLSEAEWEFAAVDRTRDAPYPWAPEGDVSVATLCETAIVARGDTDILEASRHCILEVGAEAGPVAGGSPLDVTPLGIRNLGGNLSEWVADDFTRYSDDSCWGEQIELHDADPCKVAGSVQGVLKGGSWVSLTYNAHGFFRRWAGIDLELSFVGVRCAQDVEKKK
jgi:formylglycine-generating enzyme